MKKKIYTAPTFDVVEFGSSDVICTSVQSNVGLKGGGSDAGYTGGARSKDRDGIWDED